MDADRIREEINNLSGYRVETLRALALLASEIRAVKDAETRRELTRLFEARHGRRVSVWARIPQRFDLSAVQTADGFMALSYLCQLPRAKCNELYEVHRDHLDEPLVHLLVLREVNEARPTRRERQKPLICPNCGYALLTRSDLIGG